MDTSKTFEIKPAINGGVIVNGKNTAGVPWGTDGGFQAAFTTPADMISWLAKEYGVPVDLMPVLHVKERLCVDEGCSHHGTPHECVNWIEWNGGERPVHSGTPVDVKFRDGTSEHQHRAGYWSWEHRTDANRPRDIIAYRVVPSE